MLCLFVETDLVDISSQNPFPWSLARCVLWACPVVDPPPPLRLRGACMGPWTVGFPSLPLVWCVAAPTSCVAKGHRWVFSIHGMVKSLGDSLRRR